MKRNHYFLLFILLGFFFSVQASDTIRVSDTDNFSGEKDKAFEIR